MCKRCLDQWNVIRLLYTDTYVSPEESALFWRLTFRSCFSAVLNGLLLHPFFRDLERYLMQGNLIESFYLGCRIFPEVWYSLLLLIFVVVLPFMVFGLLTLFSHGWGLSKSFECRLLFGEFPFLAMSEDVVLDGVNVMCKDVWTNETWLDRCILAFVVCFKIVRQKLTFRSCFSAVLKGWLLHAMIRDLERYLRQWNLIRSFYRGCRIVPGFWCSFLLPNCVVLLPFMVFGLLTLFFYTAENCLNGLSVDFFLETFLF